MNGKEGGCWPIYKTHSGNMSQGLFSVVLSTGRGYVSVYKSHSGNNGEGVGHAAIQGKGTVW